MQKLKHPYQIIESLLNFISDLESHSSHAFKQLRQQMHELEVTNGKLRADLNKEQNERLQLQKEYLSCERKLHHYKQEIEDNRKMKDLETQNKLFLNTTISDQVSNDNVSQTEISQKEKSCSACCRKAVDEIERRLKKTQLKLAEAKAAKGVFLTSEKKLIETLNQNKTRLKETEEALNRLRSKSRTLLRQYRAKKQTLSSVSSKISGIRSSLFGLRDLCKTKDENYKEILTHFGGQIEISAKLLANYLDVPMNPPRFEVDLKVLT